MGLVESPEEWAQKLKEKKDYRGLAAIFNSQDYSEEFQKWRKQGIAKGILREAGAEAVDAILEELATDGVGSEYLAELLVEIGDPKAVPLLKKRLDRGDFQFEPRLESEIRAFVEKHPDLIGEVEMVKCALCGKTRPVTETDYHRSVEGQVKRFCKDTCWIKRGRIIGSKDGVGCPYYTEDRMCVAGLGEPSPCSFTFRVGPSFTACHIYRTHAR